MTLFSLPFFLIKRAAWIPKEGLRSDGSAYDVITIGFQQYLAVSARCQGTALNCRRVNADEHTQAQAFIASAAPLPPPPSPLPSDALLTPL